jgi:hypothetical protein
MRLWKSLGSDIPEGDPILIPKFKVFLGFFGFVVVCAKVAQMIMNYSHPLINRYHKYVVSSWYFLQKLVPMKFSCVCVNTVKGELKEWRTKPHREPVLAVATVFV